MNAALACAYSLRAVTPRRANCRGVGSGSFFSASRAVAALAPSRPLPGAGSKEDPALSISCFNRFTSNNACQPKVVNGRSILSRGASSRGRGDDD